MRLTLADVLARLIDEGLAPAESIDRARAALRESVDTTPPWFARAIAGFGAWIATGLLIGFLVVSKIVNEETSSMIVGAALVAAATYLRRTAGPDEDFKRQFALAASLAGQILLIVGVADATHSATVAGLVALAMSVVLIAIVPDAAHRFMSALVGTVATVGTVANLRLAWPVGSVAPFGEVVVRGSDLAVLTIVAVAAYVWRAGLRSRSQDLTEMLEPVGYGTIVALFGVLLFSTFFAFADELVRGSRAARANAWHLGPLTTIGITGALVGLELSIFAEQRVKPRGEAVVAAVAGSILLGVLTLSTPGVVAAVTVLALGFDRRNRVLIGLAVVFLVKFASAYYYTLRMTLLEKSIVLVASGLLLLAARAYVELRFKPREGDA
jgi:hypothetical protein